MAAPAILALIASILSAVGSSGKDEKIDTSMASPGKGMPSAGGNTTVSGSPGAYPASNAANNISTIGSVVGSLQGAGSQGQKDPYYQMRINRRY
jgi:hypothetical protein